MLKRAIRDAYGPERTNKVPDQRDGFPGVRER